MKTKFRILLLIALGSMFFTACSKDDKLDSNSVFVDPVLTNNPLDNYLLTNYVMPYNVEVLYKYVDKTSDLSYRLVPAPYENSVRLAKLMLYAVMEPYDQVTGSRQFLRTNFPKLITFTGSVPVQSNGVIILGTAEAGTKVSLYNLLELSDANGRDADFLNYWFFKTVHHEFQHILNQNKPFPSSFKEISGTSYVDDAWNSVYTTDLAAVTGGFITRYSSKAEGEDFAEIFSHYVTRSQADFDAMIDLAGTSSTGKAIILSKLVIVKNYMSTEWGINMDVLRQNILTRYAGLSTLDLNTL